MTTGNISKEQPLIPVDVLKKLGDRYSSFQYLGSGATSTVFQAHDSILDKLVAIKILKNNDHKDLLRFQREARAASKLGHPNLVNILNFDVTEENSAFIVMDLVPGDDLKTLLTKRGRLPVETALAVAYEVAKGMSHAHAKKLAHRDLKSSNVMVADLDSDEMKVIVVDFGLVKEQEQGKTGTVSVIGSPLYMSPEQCKGEPCDERSDIYSLACIIYEMIAGSTPFQDDDLFKLLQKHAYEPAPALSSMIPNTPLPDGLDKLLLKMLEKETASRVQTMKDVKESILAIEHDLRTHSMPFSDATSAVGTPGVKGTSGAGGASGAARISLGTGTSGAGTIEAGSRFGDARKRLAAIISIALVGIAIGASVILSQQVSSEPALSPKAKERLRRNAAEIANIHNIRSCFEAESEDGGSLENRYIHCVNSDIVNDETLRFLPKSGLNLKYLKLAGTRITGEGLHYLADAGVEDLDLSRMKLSKEGWRQLGAIKSLRALSVFESEVTDADLKALAGHKNLRSLNLSRCKLITDASAETLASLPQMKYLYMVSTGITDKLLYKLAGHKSLTHLDLESTAITDSGVEKLCLQNKRLESLQIGKCDGITSKTVEVVAANEPLMKRLNFGLDTKIKPSSIRLLSACKNVNDLTINGIPIGDAELREISKLNLKRLYLGEVAFDNSSLPLLERQKSMNFLFITGPKITSESQTALERMLPGCQIVPKKGFGKDLDALFVGSRSAN